MNENNLEFWNKFTREDWEAPRGRAVAAFVLARHEKDFVKLAEIACSATGASFSTFASYAALAIMDAEQRDRERGFKPPETISLKCLSTIEPKEMKWIWAPYIPQGAMTIIQGDPGSGKTFLGAWLAALVTNGLETPDGQTMAQGSVIFQSMEDGIAEGLVPRLTAAGCDMQRCFIFEEEDKPLYVQDLQRIETAFKDIPDLRLFVIDPIQSYLGNKTDMNQANQVRGALKGLLNLCNQYGVSLVLIGHMGKSANKNLYRLIGSMDFVAQARSVLTVSESQTTPGERIVLQTKVSNAERGTAFAYHIEQHKVIFDCFKYGLTEDNLAQVPEDGSKLTDAKKFIIDSMQVQPISTNEIERQAKSMDISLVTFRRARAELKQQGVIGAYKGTLETWHWFIKERQIAVISNHLFYVDSPKFDNFDNGVENRLETPAAVGFQALSYDDNG